MKMNLHRAGRIADWEKKDPSRRSKVQKIAAATGGIVTPGNVVSALGAGFVAAGLIDVYKDEKVRRGVWKIGIGRAFDLVDGFLAHRTETKSPLGEAVDATIDKLAMGAILAVFVKKDIISKRTAWHIFSQNLANVALTAIAQEQGIDFHASAAGKQTMLLQGMTLGFNGLAYAEENSENPDMYKVSQLKLVANLCEAGAAGRGAQATAGYVKDITEGRRPLLETA